MLLHPSSICRRGAWQYAPRPDPPVSGCSATALMLLPCYHHHYSSRVAVPSAERRKQWFLSTSPELSSGRYTNQLTEWWEMYRKRKSALACQQFTQLVLTACRCSWGTSEEEIPSDSSTAGLWCSSTAHWNWGLSAGYKTGSTSPVVGQAAQAVIVSL